MNKTKVNEDEKLIKNTHVLSSIEMLTIFFFIVFDLLQ